MNNTQFFECLKCGPFTEFGPGKQARCVSCGCATGIMNSETAAPLFRSSPQRVFKAAPAPSTPVRYGTEKP